MWKLNRNCPNEECGTRTKKPYTVCFAFTFRTRRRQNYSERWRCVRKCFAVNVTTTKKQMTSERKQWTDEMVMRCGTAWFIFAFLLNATIKYRPWPWAEWHQLNSAAFHVNQSREEKIKMEIWTNFIRCDSESVSIKCKVCDFWQFLFAIYRQQRQHHRFLLAGL